MLVLVHEFGHFLVAKKLGIKVEEFGFGLEGVLLKRKDSLFGILNGIDYSIWNPQTDTFISQDFSADDLKDKYKNKEKLQKACRLPVKNDLPLFLSLNNP